MSRPRAEAVARLQTAAYVLASSVVGVPLLVLLLTQAILRQVNPRNLDLGDPASYQAELWIPVGVAVIGMIAAAAITFGRLARAAGDRAVLRYPTLIVQLQVGFAIAAVALLLLTPGLVF